MLTFSRRHLLSYVFLSEPQTGKRVLGQSTLQSETRTSGYALTCEDSCMHRVGCYTQEFLCLHVSKNPEFRLKMLCIFSPPVTLFVCRFYLSSIWLFPWQSKPVEFSRRRSQLYLDLTQVVDRHEDGRPQQARLGRDRDEREEEEGAACCLLLNYSLPGLKVD